MKIDFAQIRELLAVVSQTDVSELTIESGDEKITVKKSTSVQATSIDIPINNPQIVPLARDLETRAEPKQATPELPVNNGWVPITSPMVGTFYLSPSPSAPSFVNVGDSVSVGQTVCIIEAMKLMNDLPSEIAGRIVKVCVENGTTVEYGQSLFMVDTKG